MANELRGILFETITKVAVERACARGGIPGTVFHNKKPAAMTIEPDITVGLTADTPSHVFLITASGSAKNSEMKSWRNLAEVFEAKAQILNSPVVINVYFLSVIKEGLAKATDEVYDLVLHVDRKPYHKPLENWVAASLKLTTRIMGEREASLIQSAKETRVLDAALDGLADDLVAAMNQRNTERDTLWPLMQADYLAAAPAPARQTTTVRRGLAKLLVLPPEIRAYVYKKEPVPADELPAYATELSFFSPSIIGPKSTDKDIVGVVNLLDGAACEAVLNQAPTSVEVWANPLRNLHRVVKHVEFVETHYDAVTDPSQLHQLLLECFNNPSAMSGEASDDKVWLFEIMMSLIKAKSNKFQGYGFAQVATDSQVAAFGQGGFLLPPFVQRSKPLSPSHMAALAAGISQRFKTEVSRSDLPQLKTKVKEWVIKENLEDRLIPYRNFEPLLWLLVTELKKQNKTYFPKTTYLGWINEYTGSKTSATTPFVRVGDTLLHWKSAHGSHSNDKTKELCARARNVRYHWDAEPRTFTRRAGVNHLALIVDGDWSETNLQSLTRAGWDKIVYPDQIAALVGTLQQVGFENQ